MAYFQIMYLVEGYGRRTRLDDPDFYLPKGLSTTRWVRAADREEAIQIGWEMIEKRLFEWGGWPNWKCEEIESGTVSFWTWLRRRGNHGGFTFYGEYDYSE